MVTTPPTKRRRGRPRGTLRPGTPKTMLYMRLETSLVRELDNHAAGMELRPSRTQLIELAVRQYLERTATRA